MLSSMSHLLLLAVLCLLVLPFLSARVHQASHLTPAFPSPLPHVTAASPSVHKTVLQWERQLQTCDPNGADMDIDLTGTSRVIYAIGDADPASDSAVRVHSRMGVKNVNLMDSPSTPAMPDLTERHHVMSRPFPIDKNTLTAPSTYYHCQAFQRNFTQRSHIIKVTPQVDFYHSSLVHHMLLFRCDGAMSAADLAWAGNCYGSNTPRAVSACDQVHVLAGWAVGGGEFYYPEEVGFPIGPGLTHMMLQIHYHNPHGVTFNDSAGFILTSTPTLRKYDAGTIVVHHELSTLSIPPRQPAYNVSIYTPPDCFKGVPADGLKVFGSMLHTHETGVRVRTEHYRGGQQQPPIDANEHYDFNFQQVVSFDQEAYPVIRQGDSLKLTCTYNTVDRPNATKGGISTKDEMCMDYLWYYPAAYSQQALTIATGVALPGQKNFTTLCQMGSQRQTFLNVAPPAITQPIPPSKCRPSASTRQWGDGGVTNGSTGTTPITPEQWRLDRATYAQSTIMDNDGRYVLYWNVTKDGTGNGVIRFAAEVETTGWVGLGLSGSGAMVDADSVIGWVKTVEEGASSTVVDLTDRWNSQYSQPKVDVSQDVYNVRGVQTYLPQTVPPVNPIFYNVTKPDPLPPAAAQASREAVVVGEGVMSSSGGEGEDGAGGVVGYSGLGVVLGVTAIGLTLLLAVVLAVYFVRANKRLAHPSAMQSRLMEA